MIRLVVIALALAGGPRIADAHECHPRAGGRPMWCGQRGAGYRAPIYRYDFGVSLDRIAVSGTDSTVPEGSYDTQNLVFRGTGGFSGVYFGGEANVGRFDVRPLAARLAIGEPPPALAPDGRVASIVTIVGYRAAVGPITLGIEAAGGLRSTWRTGAVMTEEECNCDMQGVLDVRANVGRFWTPWLSTSLQVGASLVRRDEYTAALMLGISVFAFDGLR